MTNKYEDKGGFHYECEQCDHVTSDEHKCNLKVAGDVYYDNEELSPEYDSRYTGICPKCKTCFEWDSIHDTYESI